MTNVSCHIYIVTIIARSVRLSPEDRPVTRFDRMTYTNVTDTQTNGQTDGQTPHDGIVLTELMHSIAWRKCHDHQRRSRIISEHGHRKSHQQAAFYDDHVTDRDINYDDDAYRLLEDDHTRSNRLSLPELPWISMNISTCGYIRLRRGHSMDIGLSALRERKDPPTPKLKPTRGQSNLTKSASRGANSPVRGHPRGSKFVPLNSWGRGSY